MMTMTTISHSSRSQTHSRRHDGELLDTGHIHREPSDNERTIESMKPSDWAGQTIRLTATTVRAIQFLHAPSSRVDRLGRDVQSLKKTDGRSGGRGRITQLIGAAAADSRIYGVRVPGRAPSHSRGSVNSVDDIQQINCHVRPPRGNVVFVNSSAERRSTID